MHFKFLPELKLEIFFFARAAIVSAGKNYNIFRDNNGYKQRLSAPVQNEDNFPTFSLGLEFLDEAEKEKNNGKGDSANSHFSGS